MNIIIKKDGSLAVNDNPLAGKDANLENLAAFISNPSDGDAIVFNATAGVWEAAKIATLPAVDKDDDGKILTVVDGAWSAVTPE